MPNTVRAPAAAPPVPEELRPPALPTLVMWQRPSSFDQMHCYVDEGSLDLELSTLATQLERVEALPFEITAIVLSKIATHADHVRSDTARELELAEKLYGLPDIWPRLQALVRNRGMTVFAEQHFAALLRLLILHAPDAPVIAERLTDPQWLLMARALLGMGTVNDRVIDVDRGPDEWFAYLIQNGAYNHHEPALERMSRVYALFVELPQLAELANHRDAVPINDWLAEETAGLDVMQQFAVGFALLAAAHALDDGRDANDRNVIGDDLLGEVAEKVGVEATTVEKAMAADRAWYREQFAGTDGVGAAWDRVPFERRPFLKLSDGRLCLLHVRYLMSWITEGIHYRLLDAAKRHRASERYLRYLGALTERYALEMMRDAHAGPRRIGAGVVRGEQFYGGRSKKERRTPDIAVDWGSDLVLIEVVSRRLTLEAVRGGDPAVVRRDLDRMVGKKLKQLGDRVADLQNPKTGAHIPGVDMGSVRRIWPVVLTGSGLLESELLWDYVDEKSTKLRSLARVQAITLLDLSDLELLAGLVEPGFTIVEILEAKTSGSYARIDFRRFVHDDLRLTTTARARVPVQRWHDAMDATARLLGFTEEEVARLRAA